MSNFVLDNIPSFLSKIITKEGLENPLFYEKRNYYALIIVRHHIYMSLRGIVAIPPRHAFFGLDRDSNEIPEYIRDYTIRGLSISEPLQSIPGCENMRNLWAFGFDCLARNDLNPYLLSKMTEMERKKELRKSWKSYKDIEYVKTRIIKLHSLLVKEEKHNLGFGLW